MTGDETHFFGDGHDHGEPPIDPPETLPTSEPLPDPDERDPEDGIEPPEDEDVGE